VLAALAVLTVGFILFAAGIERRETRLDRAADGIVVLTGGAERIADAVQLLASGRGQRLLITGVHPDTTLEEIGRRVSVARQQLECCADIGRSALNTRGNAIETAQWVRGRGFRSLIVVTSSWHMPRALVELGRALPEVELVPYPVVTDRMREAPWWSSPATSRLLFVEYLKLLLAYVPFRPGPAVTSEAG
jgi:uncharacterized SAM-binding protein YcdF (DUF218 family)